MVQDSMWHPSSIPWSIQREGCSPASTNWAGTSSLKHGNHPGMSQNTETGWGEGQELSSLAKRKNWCFNLSWSLLILLAIFFAGQGCRYQEGFCHMKTAVGSSPVDLGTGQDCWPRQWAVPCQQITCFPQQTSTPLTASLGYSQNCGCTIPGLFVVLCYSTHKPHCHTISSDFCIYTHCYSCHTIPLDTSQWKRGKFFSPQLGKGQVNLCPCPNQLGWERGSALGRNGVGSQREMVWE